MKPFRDLSLILGISLAPAACGKGETPPQTAAAPAPATAPAPTPAPAATAAAAAEPAAAEPATAAPATPAPTVAAPTPPTECRFPDIIVGTATGKAVGSTVSDVFAAVGLDRPASEDAARTSLGDNYSFFLKDTDTLAFLADDATATLFVRKPGGPFHAFADFHTFMSESPEAKASNAGNGYAVVTVTEEYIERVKNCVDDEVDEDDCPTASGDAGMGVQHYVVDRDTMKMAFVVFDGRTESESGGCEKSRAPTVAADGNGWSLTYCNGKSEAFTLLDLTPCTAEAREKRMTAEADARMKEDDAKRTAREAARLSDSDAAARLNEARKLTSDKKFDEAVAAFDKLLETNPDLIRAMSGRAYAKMMRATPGDLDAADSEFFEAYNKIPGHADEDNKLRAQIVYNRALIAEKQNKTDRARTFFEKSHELNPTEATRKKLGL